jgi:hypothetical protein
MQNKVILIIILKVGNHGARFFKLQEVAQLQDYSA